MYYENKKDKNKSKFTVIIFLSLIVILLCIVIIKLDYSKEDSVAISSEYEASKLSTNIEENVEKEPQKIVEDVVKCVVGISKLEQNGNSIFLTDVEQKLGLGSGVILSENGYILTNQHVAGNKYGNCYVTLEDGKTHNGTVVWADINLDLAIVKISGIKLNYINLGDSDNISLAEDVYAIGRTLW